MCSSHQFLIPPSWVPQVSSPFFLAPYLDTAPLLQTTVSIHPNPTPPRSHFCLLTPSLNLPSSSLLNSSHKFFSSSSCDTRLHIKLHSSLLWSGSCTFCAEIQQLAGCLNRKTNLSLLVPVFCVITVQSSSYSPFCGTVFIGMCMHVLVLSGGC